ncbi:hypothetical protein BDEG_25721 [Batrachochytrium dendrobatidis JEL423]|uniref:Uncharacterized protein n=1 Tax=Batrachochytrium dendrobatidis (strain JEL423) TaxID=403673 RepID=A0A177WQZ6_BATDL|nr:hypothetical protein BDEG_25721 [Batrachochytrium dendrobatidis JEL423]
MELYGLPAAQQQQCREFFLPSTSTQGKLRKFIEEAVNFTKRHTHLLLRRDDRHIDTKKVWFIRAKVKLAFPVGYDECSKLKSGLEFTRTAIQFVDIRSYLVMMIFNPNIHYEANGIKMTCNLKLYPFAKSAFIQSKVQHDVIAQAPGIRILMMVSSKDKHFFNAN